MTSAAPHDSRKPARSRAGFSFAAAFVQGAALATTLAIAIAIATAIAVAPAHAQVTATADYLTRMDVDGDGRVSLVEYQDWLSYAFDAMDADHDGVLAPSEQPGGRGKPITREAHRARLAAAFARQDANRDGVLSAKELAAPPR